MKYLIVTADDFGLAKSINEGIEKAYKEGIVSFLNFIPAGDAFADALEVTKRLKPDEIGAHLSLTQTSPVTDPARIPTLVAKDKKFYKNYIHFFLRFFLGRINPDEIYIELKSQLEALKKAGVPITSLSGHEHIHMVPAILSIFIRLAKEYKIPSIRCLGREKMIPPATIKKVYKDLLLPVFVTKMENMLKESGIRHADSFLGFLDSGALQEKTLLEMIGSLEDGTTELACHPGFMGPEVLDRCIFHANCETELFALTSRNVKEMIKEKAVKLTGYGGAR